VILAVPLLVESGTYRERCDRIVVVDCPESLQVERVMARSGIGRDEVLAIMAAQASRAERLAAADDIVLNDGERAKIAPVCVIHQKYLRLSAEKVKAGC
jgi:dephospho-CoA kinase